MQDAELKEKVRKIMLEHLKEKGLRMPLSPIRDLAKLQNELKPMWIKLETAGLIQRDWNFIEFCKIAELMAFQSLVGR